MSSVARFALIGLLMVTTAVLAMIVFNMTRPATPMVAAVQPDPVPLTVNQLVTARALPAGTLLRDEDFTVRSVPSAGLAATLLTDTLANRGNLRGALLRSYLAAGSPIAMADVLQPRDRGFIASVLQEGTRAVALGVDPVSGVAGLIWPGDHVDVLLTQENEGAPKSRKAFAEVVLSDLRVIAIDQQMVQSAPSNNDVAGKLARTVTLEVDPVQAQKLAVAHNLGKLSLAIRAAADRPAVPPVTVFGSDVSPALSQDNQPIGTAIQIYNGKDHKEFVFK